MIDIRKIVIVFLIAVLFSVFVFSAIGAVYVQPKWDDFCDEQRLKAPAARDACHRAREHDDGRQPGDDDEHVAA